MGGKSRQQGGVFEEIAGRENGGMRSGAIDVNLAHGGDENPDGVRAGVEILAGLASQLVERVRGRSDLDGECGRERLDAALGFEQGKLRWSDQRHVGRSDRGNAQTEPLLRYDFTRVLLSVEMIHQALHQAVANAVV